MSAGAYATRWLTGIAAAALLLVLAAGCASTTPPAETVPELSTRLSAVDQAIADRKFGKARREIELLVRATINARETGALEPDEAEPILASATSLASALPRPQNSQDPPASQPQPGSGANGDEDQEKRQEKLEKRQEKLEKKREERQKKREEEKENEREDGEDEGGDDSGDNGPDDGHGN